MPNVSQEPGQCDLNPGDYTSALLLMLCPRDEVEGQMFKLVYSELKLF